MDCRDPVGGADADRAHRDMQRSRAQPGKQTVSALEHGAEGRVITEHAEHYGTSAGRLPWSRSKARAARGQRACFGSSAIPDSDLMLGFKQIANDARAHLSQTQKADAHGTFARAEATAPKLRLMGAPWTLPWHCGSGKHRRGARRLTPRATECSDARNA